MEFDDEAQEVIWEKGSQRIERKSCYLLLKLLHEKKGTASFAEIKELTGVRVVNGCATVVKNLRDNLRYGFPYEITSVLKTGYRLIPKQKI